MNAKLINILNAILENQIEQSDILSGLKWYENANKTIRYYSVKLGVDPNMFAKVVAILSPANVWERNLDDAYKLVFSCLYEPTQLEKLTFTTYGKNVEKAIEIIQGNRDFEPTNSNMKTYSFYRNLMLDTEYVTIDRWMLRLIDFEMYFGKSLTKKRYEEYAAYFHELARIHKMKVYQIQAIFWEYLRNNA